MAKIPNRKDLQDLNKELSAFEDALLNISSKLSSTIKDSLRSVRDEAKTVGEILEKQISNTIKSMARDLDDTVKSTLDLAKGTTSVSKIQQKIQRQKVKALSIEKNLSTLQKNGLITLDDYNKSLGELFDTQKAHLSVMEEQLDMAKEIKKRIGITGKIIKGISKLPIIGDLINAEEILTNINHQAFLGKTKLQIMGTALEGVLGSIKQNLGDPLVLIGLFKKLIDAVQSFSKMSVKIGQSFLGLAGSTKQVRADLVDMAANNRYLNFEEALGHMVSINKLTGTNLKLTQDQVNHMQRLTNLMGLSSETASGLFEISTLTGQSFDDSLTNIASITEELNATEGQILSVNDVVEKFVSASSQIRANLANNPELLARAAFQAAKLGLTLNQIQDLSRGTLNFQSSIEDEMSAELLLQKNLNLEALRYATLTGDVATQGKEIERIIKDNIESTKGNVIAQEALAKTLNMSVEQMFKISDEMKLQDKLAEMGVDKRISLSDYNNLALKKQQELSKELGKQVTLEDAKNAISKDNLNDLAKQAELSQELSRGIENIKDNLVKMLVDTGVLGRLEKFTKLAADNPKAAIAGFATVLGGILLAQKAIPQNVRIVGGGGFGGGIGGGGKGKVVGGGGIGGGGKGKILKGGMKRSMKRAGLKMFGKNLGKAGIKSIGKKIPIVGTLLGLGFAAQRAMKGDWLGAGMELTSGLVSNLPGVGTAASLGIDAALAAKDVKASNGTAADFISRPGQPIQKFRKDDIIVGGTSLGGGNEVVPLLKELIVAVKQGGDIYMDGAKVGKSLALSTSKIG